MAAERVVECGVQQFDRVAVLAAHDRPGEAGLERDLVHDFAGEVAEREPFALARKLPAIRPERGHAEFLWHKRRGLRHDEIAIRRDHRVGGKCEVNSVGEAPSGQAHGIGAGVVQFHELGRLGLAVGMVVNLVDHHRTGR